MNKFVAFVNGLIDNLKKYKNQIDKSDVIQKLKTLEFEEFPEILLKIQQCLAKHLESRSFCQIL